MSRSAHELVLDLEPPVRTETGLMYNATVVGCSAPDGHWNAWLEFVSPHSQEVLRTGIETHQANEADLHHWASLLSDVYLRGALERASIASAETAVHRRAVTEATRAGEGAGANTLDPWELFALGEHVLRRELLLFRRATLLALIINHDLNPRALDLSRFTKAQLVAFMVAAIEARDGRTNGDRKRARRAS